MRREGQCRARRARATLADVADPPLPDPAQGARSRRRRADAHAQGAARIRRREVRGADRRAVRRQGGRSTSRRRCKFEDGRTGMVAADLRDRRREDVPARSAQAGRLRRAGSRCARDRRRDPEARQHLAVVRRREGADRHQLRRARARDPRDHRPQRRGQELDAQRDQRRLPPAAGHDHVPRRGAPRHGHARGRRARHRAHVPEHRAVPGHVGARQHHDRPQPQDEGDLPRAGDLGRPRAARGARQSPQGRGGDRLPRDPAHPQDAGRAAALRPAEARRARAARSRPSRRCCCSTSRWPA